MKAYTKPELQIVNVTTARIVMGSINTSSTNDDSFSVGIKTGGGSTPSQMTRDQSRTSGGLWSDMK